MPKQKVLKEALVAKLLDLSAPTKARQGYQQFMHESYETVIKPKIVEEWNKKVAAEKLPPGSKPTPSFRTSIAREMFKALPKSEQDRITNQAKNEAVWAKEQYETVIDEPPSNPQDISRAIGNIPTILNSTMMAIHETTKMTIAVVYGGPDPFQSDKHIVRCALYPPENLQKPELPPIHISDYSHKSFKKLVRRINQRSKGHSLKSSNMSENAGKLPDTSEVSMTEQKTPTQLATSQPGDRLEGPEVEIEDEDGDVVEITPKDARKSARSKVSNFKALNSHAPLPDSSTSTSTSPGTLPAEPVEPLPVDKERKQRKSPLSPKKTVTQTALSATDVVATPQQEQGWAVRSTSASKQAEGSSNHKNANSNFRSVNPHPTSSKKRKRSEDNVARMGTPTSDPSVVLVPTKSIGDYIIRRSLERFSNASI